MISRFVRSLLVRSLALAVLAFAMPGAAELVREVVSAVVADDCCKDDCSSSESCPGDCGHCKCCVHLTALVPAVPSWEDASFGIPRALVVSLPYSEPTSGHAVPPFRPPAA